MRFFILSLGLVTEILAAGVGHGQTLKGVPLHEKYLRDHAETRGFMLGRPVNARPSPDGKTVLFLRARPREARMSLVEFEVASGKTKELLTPEMLLGSAAEHLSAEEKARRERMRVSLAGLTNFQLSRDGKLILLSLSGRLYLYRRAEGKAHALNTGKDPIVDPKLAPDGRHIAFVRGRDVYVLSLETEKEWAVTSGGTDRISHGLAEFVAQEEMGRFTGYWWSPDSRSIAYEEADATGVETWHVADPARPEATPTPSYYPRPGKANVKARLGVVAATGGRTTWVKWDEGTYPYLAAVRWPKKGPLSVVVQSRDQKKLLLLQADPATGKTTTLLAEKDPVWINLDRDMPHWLADGSAFLWASERAGGPRLELRKASGKLERVLVPPTEGFIGVIDVDTKVREVTFSAGTDPTDVRIYRVGLEGGQPVPVALDAGVHNAVFAKNHSLYVLTSQDGRRMPTATVHRRDGTLVGTLPSVAEEPPFIPKLEIAKVGEKPGFYTAVIRPRAFAANKRYPVIVDVYGGPHHQVVQAAMGRWLLDQWLADRGFIVVAIDGRGTPRRGRDWERAIAKRFGTVPLDDQVAGLKALGARHPEMDLTRVGITGWSFGGYMSALAVLRRPDIFKAAVAGAPVVSWLDYDTHYTERYLGLPQENEKAYKEASLLTYAGGLQRPLLLVHGTADDNVYFRHTLRLVDALFRAGKDFEVLPLSSLTHMVPDPVVTIRLRTRIAAFFRKHLGKPVAQAAVE